MFTSHQWIPVVIIGVGATLLLDLWLAGLKWLGVPSGNLALVGRWVIRMARGQFSDTPVANSEPARNELAAGWLIHYAVGMVFAAALVALQGVGWVQQPTLVPALLTGLATVAMPLFVMQPAMGLGFAASRTPAPVQNCVRSVANHAVFGVGMYVTAIAMKASIS